MYVMIKGTSRIRCGGEIVGSGDDMLAKPGPLELLHYVVEETDSLCSS
jgi:hypothetical protein